MKYVYNTLAVFLCIFVLVGVNTNLFEQLPNLAIFGAMGLSLVFLDKPAIERWKDWKPARGIDIGLAILTFVIFGYMFVHNAKLTEFLWIDELSLGDRAGIETKSEFIIGAIGVLLVLEATRRAIGWTLPILCFGFMVFAFYGQSLPDWAFPHRGFAWDKVATSSFLQSGTGGVFGIALSIMFKYVFLFVLFGTLLEQTGATGYVIRFARNLFRNSIGGPAKVAVVSSGLMGSLSGSAVANTATTGTFTIPLMKSSGFSSNSAGGVEAAASAGGALMPPIMGAGAYMMMETVASKPTYLEIIQAALIPAILYYFALLLTVHFHSKRIDAKSEANIGDDPSPSNATTEDRESNPDAPHQDADPKKKSSPEPANESVFQGIVFFGSFLVLIGILLTGRTPFFAVSIGLASVVVLSSFNRQTLLSPQKIIDAGIGAARSGVALIVAAACVGIILAIVDLTGLGSAFPPKILELAGTSVLLALLLLMVSTILLGMGLPSAICYLLMAGIVTFALRGLNTPELAAHLFIFYFGMMSMVTPPVALAAYAAAAISKGQAIATSFQAFRFALVGFALPFFFVFNPELLMLAQDGSAAPLTSVVLAVIVALVATYGLAAAIAGQAAGQLNWAWRSGLLTLSLIILLTRIGDHWISTAAIIALVALLIVEAVVGARKANQQTKS